MSMSVGSVGMPKVQLEANGGVKTAVNANQQQNNGHMAKNSALMKTLSRSPNALKCSGKAVAV